MKTPQPYASVVVKLLQSHALYAIDDRPYWEMLLVHEPAVQAYFEQIGVKVDVNRSDGYARLTQTTDGEPDTEEVGTPDQPLRLLRRTRLTYEQSLLCVVLRKWLEEHEGNPEIISPKLFATQAAIRERIELFFQQQPNQKALFSKLDRVIKSLVDHGLLKLNRQDDANADLTQYEIRPLLKARISHDQLETFLTSLRRYAQSV